MPTTPFRPRVAYLSYSTAEFDSRTRRMARSAVSAGYDVIVYARWEPGLPLAEEQDGYRIVRVAANWQLAVPGLRRRGRRAVEARLRRPAARTRTPRRSVTAGPHSTSTPPPLADGPERDTVPPWVPSRLRGTRLAPVIRRMRRIFSWRPAIPLSRQVLIFPLRPMGWAAALDAVAQPADIWHGMWAGSLPALQTLRRRHGGRAIYDSRDVYMHAREFDRMHPWRRALFSAIERRWARGADAVVTVNDAYADILAETLGIERPVVVMNCPERWTLPVSRPDRIRAALSLPQETAIVLYQGNLMSDRGIEQSMDAILSVPGATLVLLGYGSLAKRFERRSAAAPYAGRVHVLPAVPPGDLLEWTASADVLVVAIQPTSLNHRFTTPQKLFEALAVGVPVVGSDMPGIAAVVRSTGSGVLVDATSSDAIAAGIRSLLEAPPDEQAAMRERARRAAEERYNWDVQVASLFDLYDRLVQRQVPPKPAA